VRNMLLRVVEEDIGDQRVWPALRLVVALAVLPRCAGPEVERREGKLAQLRADDALIDIVPADEAGSAGGTR
jgi:hypothetical protein